MSTKYFNMTHVCIKGVLNCPSKMSVSQNFGQILWVLEVPFFRKKPSQSLKFWKQRKSAKKHLRLTKICLVSESRKLLPWPLSNFDTPYQSTWSLVTPIYRQLGLLKHFEVGQWIFWVSNAKCRIFCAQFYIIFCILWIWSDNWLNKGVLRWLQNITKLWSVRPELWIMS